MPLETGTTISHLVRENPLRTDEVSQGDDHLRLIKEVLKAQFPGENGDGFAKPITATEDEINHLEGVTYNINEALEGITAGALNNLFAPVGTIMLFRQNVPPTGWSRITNGANNAVLRITSQMDQDGGGTHNPFFLVRNHAHATKGHALSVGQMPAHSHSMFKSATSNSSTPVGSGQAVAGSRDVGSSGSDYFMAASVGGGDAGVTKTRGSSQSHSHGNTEPSNQEVWLPKYANVVAGIKDA